MYTVTHSNRLLPTHPPRPGNRQASKEDTVVLRLQSWWFFVRVALEYDLGLARAYMAGTSHPPTHPPIQPSHNT